MYTLKYFDGRGPAEVTRIMFAIAKTSFVDVRLAFDLKAHKSVDFDAMKEAGECDINLGRLPIFTYKGPEGEVTFGQSKTIERFVAKKLGFMGSNDNEAALIDMVAEHVRDIKQKYSDAKSGKKDEDLTAAKAKFVSEDLPAWFGKLEKCLTGTEGYAIGNKLSLADISIHHIVKDYLDDLEGAAAATSACPRIQSAAEAVQVAGQEWFDTRPKTVF